ncbi:Nuclear mRNA export protein THP1 [Candida viswanathii]|uniref:Nuclear mRNA export protein THP1 n=1 Tax=Candida viswanathii TaxID=5486 RepID=A0A367YBI0_9ASCO|nr:Nuclear mRNA export protein THP1 [Candida viswanathii]
MSLMKFINEINQTYNITDNNSKIVELTRLLTIDPEQNKYIAIIYHANSIPATITTLYDDDWSAFNMIITSFVKLCHEIDPWSVLRSFDLYAAYLNDLSIGFSNNNYGWLLSNVIESATRMIVPWAKKLDLMMYFKEQGGKFRLNYMASLILKIFNHIRINDSNVYKNSIILYLGNTLCYIYFKLDNPLLCQNVFSNMQNTSLKLKDYPVTQQLKYKYYLAKFYLIKNHLLESFENLKWCLVNTGSAKNQKLILELLIPVSLIIGVKPNFAYLRSRGLDFEFFGIYEQIAYAVKTGDFMTFKQVVQQNYQYLKDKNLLLLMNKLDILVLRNLVKKVWLLLDKPASLDYTRIPVAGHINDELYLENLLVTLIDSNLIKGKLTMNKTVVLSKNDPFPLVFNIYKVRFAKRSLNQWM